MTNSDSLPAALFDGESASRHSVTVVRTENALAIIHEDGREESVPWSMIFLGDSKGTWLSLKRNDVFGWRLVLTDPRALAWRQDLTRGDSLKDLARCYGWPAFAATSVLVVGLISVVAFNFMDWVVPLIPRDQVIAEMSGGEMCDNKPGLSVLNTLAMRMYPDLKDVNVNVKVIDDPTTNAFAAPGGRIALFRGVIEEAKNPDEVAGVLAHELGHAAKKHPERHLVRAFGFGILISSVGGDLGGVADMLLTLSNSREYEREADQEAVEALERIGASPLGLATFFERMAKTEGPTNKGISRAMSYLSTHPELTDRANAARKKFEPNMRYKPSLDAAAWAAVQSMCKS
jgi:beta-barrel assembly-enhancing protease